MYYSNSIFKLKNRMCKGINLVYLFIQKMFVDVSTALFDILQ